MPRTVSKLMNHIRISHGIAVVTLAFALLAGALEADEGKAAEREL